MAPAVVSLVYDVIRILFITSCIQKHVCVELYKMELLSIKF